MITYVYIYIYIYLISRVAHTWALCHTNERECVTCYTFTHTNDFRVWHVRVVSHIWMSHVTHVTHTNEWHWVLSHTSLSGIECYHTHQFIRVTHWVLSHTSGIECHHTHPAMRVTHWVLSLAGCEWHLALSAITHIWHWVTSGIECYHTHPAMRVTHWVLSHTWVALSAITHINLYGWQFIRVTWRTFTSCHPYKLVSRHT